MIRNRIAMVIVSISMLLFYIFCNSYSALFALIIFAVLSAVSVVHCAAVSRKITAAVSKTDSHADTAKRTIEFCVSCENKSRLPACGILLKIAFSDPCDSGEIRTIVKTAVAGRDKTRVYIPLSVPYAACVRGRLISAKVCGSFGVLALPAKISRDSVEMIITPSSQPCEIKSSALVSPSPDSDIFSDTIKGDDRSQIFELRDYRLGDDMRNVHWPLSSKRGSLIVKEFSKPIEENLIVLIETSVPDGLSIVEKKKISDCLLSAFVQLSMVLIGEGHRFSASIYSRPAQKNVVMTISRAEDISLLLKMFLSEKMPSGRGLTLDTYRSSYHNDETAYYIFDSLCIDADTFDDKGLVCIDVSDGR